MNEGTIVEPVNTFRTPKGEEPWGWRRGCLAAHAQGVPLGGMAAVGLRVSTYPKNQGKQGLRFDAQIDLWSGRVSVRVGDPK